MPIQVLTSLADVSTALEWKSLSIHESIGQPDTLTVEMFNLNATVESYLGVDESYLYTHVYLGSDILFSGLGTGIRRRNDHGAVTYALQCVGWEFLAPKRLVGRPNGDMFTIQEDGDPDRLPTPVAIDPSATGAPRASAVSALFNAYWAYPAIDTTTYVFEIVPDPLNAEEITWSGSDIDGAMNDMCAAGSAAAMWWIANDAPAVGNTSAPHLALHFGLVTLPDDGDDGDDLLLGFPSADFPVNVAPYAISDTPNWTTSIMASAVPEIDVDHSRRVNSVYVRGATGWAIDVFPAPPSFGVPYQIGDTHIGGTGWVGAYGGIWGEAYIDAPAAVTAEQRDAYGNAYLGAYDRASVSGTILVEGYDGWHKGQAIKVTDSGLGLDERWLLIRSVSITAKSPGGEAMSYVLNVGDVLDPQIGYALRQQRLKDQRKPVDPGTRFIPFVGDLTLSAGETAPLTMQFATDAGKLVPVKGVGAIWHLLLNGVDVEDVEDTDNAFYLTDLVEVTDALGQITATLHAGAGATDSDAVKPWAQVVIP